MTWKDITLEKYYKIQDLMAVQDDYTVLNLMDLVYGINSEDINIWELSKYDISFLKNPIEEGKLPKKLEVNGHIYELKADLTRVTAAQYVDFSNYTKAKTLKYEDILSVFIIPKGHKYGDGYDINEVKQDILQLNMVDINAISQFFFRQFELFSETFRLYLIQYLKKEEKTAKGEQKEKIQETIEKLLEVNFPDLASYHTLLRTAHSQTKD